MAAFKINHVAVFLLQLASLLSASPVNGKLHPKDLINQQLKDIRDHCSRPQKEVLHVSDVVSKNYSGLLVAGDYSNLRDGNLELSPSILLVDRCNSRCKDAYEVTCKAVEEKNVELVLHFEDKHGKHHTLRVIEHTNCHCINAS